MEPALLFACALAFFHASEFLLAAAYNREQLGWECEWLGFFVARHNSSPHALLLPLPTSPPSRTFQRLNLPPPWCPWQPRHAAWLFSKPYCAAMLAACVEHAAELRWAPWLKVAAVSYAGLAAVVAGELLRKVAMVGAGCVWEGQ